MQRETDTLNQAKLTSERVIKSLRNVITIGVETVPDKENNLNYPQKKSRKREKIHEISKINEELKYAKKELTQLSRKLDMEKENNVTSNKKYKFQVNKSEKNATLKTINLNLENKINSKNKNIEPITDIQGQ